MTSAWSATFGCWKARFAATSDQRVETYPKLSNDQWSGCIDDEPVLLAY